MKPILEIQNISKRYVIGGNKERYLSLREQLVNNFRKGFRAPKESFLALDDVSFEVMPGETVGVIGKNGAGKSTLLKILSRITPPTTGKILARGRVASLLEVGTGFHPELSGRENVYLNGSILGLTRSEIDKKFDEIVDFSGVGKFLETPLKRYSSGMQLRLAFAVAAHLEPEILVIDEVLAVGDAEFQKKCLGKMDEVSKSGRTVLFVSHNMEAVRNLCTKGVMLVKGQCKSVGPIEDIIEEYINQYTAEPEGASMTIPRDKKFSTWITELSVIADGQHNANVNMGASLAFDIKFESETPVKDLVIGYVISTLKGEKVINANTVYQPYTSYEEGVIKGKVRCQIGTVPLMPGRYQVSFWLGRSIQLMQQLDDILTFEVLPQDLWGKGQLPPKNASSLWWNTDFQFLPESVSSAKN
ncbi:MAG: ABC transporter ATP-binding protein [Bacteroidota bacterium]